MEPSDAELWERSRGGDREAFAALFERHAKTIYNYCFRRVGSWATAEDLLFVVFLEAWRRRRKDLPPEKVLPRLYWVATNVVRNERRSERRFAAALRRVPPVEPEPDFAASSDERVDDEWRAQGALERLRKLPRREQDVLMLCAVAELSYEDAALALDLPVGTVRSRLFARGGGCGNSISSSDMSGVRARPCRRHASDDRRDLLPTPSRPSVRPPRDPEAAPARRDRGRAGAASRSLVAADARRGRRRARPRGREGRHRRRFRRLQRARQSAGADEPGRPRRANAGRNSHRLLRASSPRSADAHDAQVVLQPLLPPRALERAPPHGLAALGHDLCHHGPSRRPLHDRCHERLRASAHQVALPAASPWTASALSRSRLHPAAGT